MQTHAALYSTLHPTAYPDDSRENRMLIHMCKMYKIIPCEFDRNGREAPVRASPGGPGVLGYLLLGTSTWGARLPTCRVSSAAPRV